MNKRIKNKQVTKQTKSLNSRPKSQRFCIFIFSIAHFLRAILTIRTNGTFRFARHTSQSFAKPKEPVFVNKLIEVTI
jgi:hypothetical protein